MFNYFINGFWLYNFILSILIFYDIQTKQKVEAFNYIVIGVKVVQILNQRYVTLLYHGGQTILFEQVFINEYMHWACENIFMFPE